MDKQIIPVATELEHAAREPQEIVDGLEELGIFGLTVPKEYDGLGESLLTYALCVEEIARGWMSVSGVINTHFVVAYMLMRHGTDEQKQKMPEQDEQPGRSAAPSPCPSRGSAATWPRSRPRPSSIRSGRTTGSSTAGRCG